MSLKEYRRKRNFKKTPEPKGKVAKATGKASFVVQKHAASHDHFDFRLEIGGTFKSWAVPKGPSLNPLDQRLAVFVEDHPLEYGSFEGVIPKGNYGAGTVMIWDEGTFEERSAAGRAKDDKKLLEGMESGHITFLLQGAKLSGEFALVRMKKAESPKLWLLLKKRDSSAVFQKYETDDVSAVSGRSMKEIAKLSEGEGAVWLPGKGRKTPAPKRKVATALPKKTIAPAESASTLPHRIRAMQAVPSLRRPDSGQWLYETDWRGHRVIAEVEKGHVSLLSRTSLPLNAKFPAIVAALKKAKKAMVLDGEVLENEDGSFEYVVSDVLYFAGEDLRERPLSDRKKKLAKALTFSAPLSLASFVTDWAKAEALAKKQEATAVIAKRADSGYRSGIARDWLRLSVGAPRGIVPSASTAKKKLMKTDAPLRDEPPLTHLTKLYWPEEKITKGDLVAYYRTVASTILPYLVDRPESLHRQPDGVRTEGFFQKDNNGYVPRRIATKRVFSKSSDKTVNYLLCQDAWTLLYLANMGCIELNPWLARVQDIERPDWVVIDLDPDDSNTFAQVIEAALETRKVLQSVGADAWIKTSGATGLHLFVPTGGKCDFDESRLFAEAVVRIVHERLPQFTSIERNPARRRGRIYLDFLQNRRGQTIAAPYCVRPRPGATVSAPLDWKEVKRGLDPAAFTIATMPKRIARLGDLWAPMAKKSYNIGVLTKELSRKA